MKETVILAGVDGYIGNALVQKLLFKGYRVVGVDNFLRRDWVRDTMKSFSAIPIFDMEEKTKEFKKLGDFEFYKFDLAKDYEKIYDLLKKEKPSTIINLAHIPSGPFSQISHTYADLTLTNNYIGTNNILWAMRENCPDAHYITIGTTGEYDHYSNIDIEEGYIKINHNGRESNEMIYPRRPGSIYHCCYDNITEVLTEDGWKFFKDLSYTDKIATLNRDKDLLEYQTPTNIFNYCYDGEMISIKNRSVDLKITPNHKVFETSRRTNDLSVWRLTEAGDVYGKNCVMRRSVSNWVGEDLKVWKIPECWVEVTNQHYERGMSDSIYIDIYEWLLFFGWWLTEGSLYKNNVVVSQKKIYNFDEIMRCLSVFGRKVQTNTKEGQVSSFSIKHYQLSKYLNSFGKSKDKYIPKRLKNLPKDKLLYLLNILLKGDGYVKDKHYKFEACYYTISKRLADDVQEIAFKCGYSTSIGSFDRGINKEYVVYITENKTTQFITSSSVFEGRQKPLYSKDKYSGTVYCAEVPNSIMYVRRNGKPVWSGNSKTASTYLIDFLARSWDLRCTDVQQSVVFGAFTDEIDETKIYSRLDSDEAAGTVINRFIVQAVLEVPLTVYGEGKHQRGFLSLNDCVQALNIAVENPAEKGKTQVWNQLSEWHSMNSLAEMVKEVCGNIEISHIPTPRNEYTGEHYYRYITQKLQKLGYKPTREIKEEIKYVYDILKDIDISGLKDVVIPKITWK